MTTCRTSLAHTHRSPLLQGARAVLGAALLLVAILPAKAQEAPADTVAEHQFTDTVMASVLVASPGKAIYQVGGHAALRLQCPAYNLDNVFSYETDNAGGTLGQLLGMAKGRFNAITFDEYIGSFAKEGRGIKEFPLNLTDKQIRDLWRMCDESVESRVEDDFNIRFHNCNERLMQKVTLAMWPDTILMQEQRLSTMSNGKFLREIFKKDTPWAAAIFVEGCGTGADVTDSWHSRMFPVTVNEYFRDAQIVSPDASRRPLLSGSSKEIVPVQWQPNAPAITPEVIAIIALVLSMLASIADVCGKFPWEIKIFDFTALTLETLVAVTLMLMAVIPASISSGWSWMFIPFNVFPAAVWFICRRHEQIVRWFFIVYGCACLTFVIAPLWTAQADCWSSILSLAISIRVLTHYLRK